MIFHSLNVSFLSLVTGIESFLNVRRMWNLKEGGWGEICFLVVAAHDTKKARYRQLIERYKPPSFKAWRYFLITIQSDFTDNP